MNAAATTMLEIDDILAIPDDIVNSINSSLELNCTLRMSLEPSQVVVAIAAAGKNTNLEFNISFFHACVRVRVCTLRVTLSHVIN